MKKKERKKLEKTRQNKTKKGEVRSPHKSPCFSTKEPGIEKALHVTLAHAAWTLVNSAMEDSSERDSKLPVFEIKR